MTEKRRIEAVVFDNDGLLLDTEPWQHEAWQLEEVTAKNWARYAGQSAAQTSRELMEDFPHLREAGHTSEGLLERWERNAGQFASERTPEVLPYAEESIRYFHYKGARIAIASSASLSQTRDKLIRSGLYEILSNLFGKKGGFEFIVSGYDVRRNKPYPDIYQAALKMLGASPEKTIALEDTGSGIEAAYRTGIVPLAVPNVYVKEQMANGLTTIQNAHKIFSDLGEVIRYCGKAFKFPR